MRVILKDNVAGLGQKDDVKEVKPGYWRNFLLPQGLAVEATAQLIELVQKRREEREKIKKAETEKLAKGLDELEGKTLVIKARADKKGNLFSGIAAKKIAALIKKEEGIDVAPETVKIKEPIKKIGLYEVNVGENVLKIKIEAV